MYVPKVGLRPSHRLRIMSLTDHDCHNSYYTLEKHISCCHVFKFDWDHCSRIQVSLRLAGCLPVSLPGGGSNARAAAAGRECHSDTGLQVGNSDSGCVTVSLSGMDFQVNGSKQWSGYQGHHHARMIFIITIKPCQTVPVTVLAANEPGPPGGGLGIARAGLPVHNHSKASDQGSG